MKRFVNRFFPLLILVLLFQTKDGICGFGVRLTGFGVTKLVAANGSVLATDGKTIVVVNQNGERTGAVQLGLDNAYMLQDAVYSQGNYYFLYQHSNGDVDFMLVALNESLTPLWQKSFSQLGSAFGYAMAPASGGGVVVAGRSCSSGFFLVVVDHNGNVAWHRQYLSGDATALPGAIVNVGNGYAVAYKFGSGNLGMMQCNTSGDVTLASASAIGADFYIKGMTNAPEGYGVLLNLSSAGTNAIVTFTNALQPEQRLNIGAASALQFTGIAALNGNYFVTGNLLQAGTSNLDMIYACVDPTNQTATAICTGSANAYDDGRSVAVLDGRLWIGGTLAGNGELSSVESNALEMCVYQPVSLNVQPVAVTSTSTGVSAAATLAFDVQTSTASSFASSVGVDVTCASSGVTAVEETAHAAAVASFGMYPNPASESFTVELSGAASGQLSLYTLTGQRVLTQIIHQGVNRIDASALPEAAYLAVVKNENAARLQTQRIVIR